MTEEDTDQAPQEAEEEEQPQQQSGMRELAEFINSFYDKESGTFPKGPEGVVTMVGKKFGEQAENVARKFVERMAPQQSTDQNPELAELTRVGELAGVSEGPMWDKIKAAGGKAKDAAAGAAKGVKTFFNTSANDLPDMNPKLSSQQKDAIVGKYLIDKDYISNDDLQAAIKMSQPYGGLHATALKAEVNFNDQRDVESYVNKFLAKRFNKKTNQLDSPPGVKDADVYQMNLPREDMDMEEGPMWDKVKAFGSKAKDAISNLTDYDAEGMHRRNFEKWIDKQQGLVRHKDELLQFFDDEIKSGTESDQAGRKALNSLKIKARSINQESNNELARIKQLAKI
jgi:hypothetical protein